MKTNPEHVERIVLADIAASFPVYFEDQVKFRNTNATPIIANCSLLVNRVENG